jgi:hypothetical protein
MDPIMLRLLWKAGAKPTTPFLQALFADFEKGGDGTVVLAPYTKPKTSVGRFILHRFCGDEEYSVVSYQYCRLPALFVP